jgi:hypothetical protein
MFPTTKYGITSNPGIIESLGGILGPDLSICGRHVISQITPVRYLLPNFRASDLARDSVREFPCLFTNFEADTPFFNPLLWTREKGFPNNP